MHLITFLPQHIHNNHYYALATIPLPPPIANLRVTTWTPTSITATWEQPEGAIAVDRYETQLATIINF